MAGNFIPMQRSGIFDEVTSHPMVFSRTGYVLHQLAEIAAMQLSPAFPGRADECNGETLIIGHSDDGGLTISRVPFNADFFGIHGFIGKEIIQRAAGAPRPGAECAPVIRLAVLAFVHQPDDALCQSRPIVCLDTVGNENGIAPAFRENLLLPGWGGWGR